MGFGTIKDKFALAAVTLLAMAMASPAFAQTKIGGDECTDGTLGGMICNAINSSTRLPAVIGGLAYMAGLICGVMGILKLRDHVESPHHNKLSDSMKRFAAGGAFFAFPFVTDVIRATIEGKGSQELKSTGFAGKTSGAGLDSMIVKLVANVFEPIVVGAGYIGWIAGLIFVFIGISRLLKTEQQGAQGPTGIGTIMTFLVAGALFSLNSIVSFINTSVFGAATVQTNGVLQYTQGMGNGADHANAVIGAIVGFAFILGWISVIRGLFIVRGVSEGSQQASMMAAITHLIGGILAINLGGVIMAVQTTLGITAYGIRF